MHLAELYNIVAFLIILSKEMFLKTSAPHVNSHCPFSVMELAPKFSLAYSQGWLIYIILFKYFITDKNDTSVKLPF